MAKSLVDNEQTICFMEMLISDIEYILRKADDVHTSTEINRENINNAKKNFKEIARLQGILQSEEYGSLSENHRERVAAAQEALPSLRAWVGEHSTTFLGNNN